MSACTFHLVSDRWTGEHCEYPAAVSLSLTHALASASQGCSGEKTPYGWSWFALSDTVTPVAERVTHVDGCLAMEVCTTAFSSADSPWSSLKLSLVAAGTGLTASAKPPKAVLWFYTTHNCSGDAIDLLAISDRGLRGYVAAVDDGLPDFEVDLANQVLFASDLTNAGVVSPSLGVQFSRPMDCLQTRVVRASRSS